MNINLLLARDFRNLKKIRFEPHPGFNIIWGDNAQGKTNILEALYLLGNLKSFRGARNDEIIRHRTTASTLHGVVNSDGVSDRLDLLIERKGKKACLNGKEIRKAADFTNRFCTVLFSPEEVGIVKGPPVSRRALVDRAVFQFDAVFIDRVQEYQRCLKQRNTLLREEASLGLLEPWNEALIKTGAMVRRDRSVFLQEMLPLMQQTYAAISEKKEKADLSFSGMGKDLKDLEKELRTELEGSRAQERKYGQTLTGPHRDDMCFLVDDRPLRSFGSQGQQRSYILSFKTAQILLHEKKKGHSPVLLLDDMTSELDRRRQQFFFSFLLERKGQVFITTTDARKLVKEGIKSPLSFRMCEGDLQPG